MANVLLDNVSKSFDKTDVIQNVTLEVKDQEFVVLVGPSGCGKSTVLRMIAGLETPTDGAIKIDDAVMNDIAPKDRDIAMVFQNYALYPHMSVYDNMAFGLKMRDVPKEEIDKKVKDVAEILDLSALLDRKPRQLSGGQRQRVALGRAIVRDPKVFLMDEPLSNLDAKLRVHMRSEIAKLHKRLNATTVYVTHDQAEAMTMGDRVVILHKGAIQQTDTPLNVYNEPANLFVAGFIGAMNFVTGLIDNEGLKLGDDSHIPLPGRLGKATKDMDGRAAVLGIRPEHFSAGTHDGHVIDITPERIEQLGNEQLVHFTLSGETMIAALPPTETIEIGKPLTLTIDMDKVSLFDGATESRIG